MPLAAGRRSPQLVLLAPLLTGGLQSPLALLLPFEAMALNWGALAVPAVVAVRALAPAALGQSDRPASAPIVGRARQGPPGAALAVAGAGDPRRALPFLPGIDRRVVDIFTLVLTYVMLGWGLNIVVGLAGLLDLGYVAFYAVGAYSYALLSTTYGLSFWECLPIAGAMAALLRHRAGLPGAAPARRLSGDRHARLRRDDPHRPDQLVVVHRRAERHQRCRPAVLLRPAVRPQPGRGHRQLPHLLRPGVRSLSPRRLPLLPDPRLRPAHQPGSPCGSAACRWAAPGRRCARTRSPAGRSASTRPTPS